MLIATNNVGYQNLMVLITKSFTEDTTSVPTWIRNFCARTDRLIAIIPSLCRRSRAACEQGDQQNPCAVSVVLLRSSTPTIPLLHAQCSPWLSGNDATKSQVFLRPQRATCLAVSPSVRAWARSSQHCARISRNQRTSFQVTYC